MIKGVTIFKRSGVHFIRYVTSLNLQLCIKPFIYLPIVAEHEVPGSIPGKGKVLLEFFHQEFACEHDIFSTTSHVQVAERYW